ncbi:MAG: lipid-A-disaccharide synthase [Alphaproteobacteria bacterium CG_4_10_14_0_8_um_filter_53_9]|nr:MAG: lipid-A-disaccharide synthase [Alphaproteobacteria bacterium CG_4_10_14_0_8_um_filter_53_9]
MRRTCLSMPNNLPVLITAGEISGDRLGAEVMRGLKQKNASLKFFGVGGPLMQKEGLIELFPMEDINVMGLVEVIPAIPCILRRLRELKLWMRTYQPQAVITVDAQDFSARLRKAARKAAPQAKLVQVSSPTIWAWRAGRAKALKRDTDAVLTLFPFEVEVLAKHGILATYIGHPALGYLPAPQAGAPKTFQLALMPGSRASEVARHLPAMLGTLTRLQKLLPSLTATLILPSKTLLDTLPEPLRTHAATLPLTPPAERFETLQNAALALAKSGTNNLELALLGTPAIVGYKTSWITYNIAKYLIKTKYISLPNIILNKLIYPEFIQNAFTEQNLTRAAYPLLTDSKAAGRQTESLKHLRQIMETESPPSHLAATAITALLT